MAASTRARRHARTIARIEAEAAGFSPTVAEAIALSAFHDCPANAKPREATAIAIRTVEAHVAHRVENGLPVRDRVEA